MTQNSVSDTECKSEATQMFSEGTQSNSAIVLEGPWFQTARPVESDGSRSLNQTQKKTGETAQSENQTQMNTEETVRCPENFPNPRHPLSTPLKSVTVSTLNYESDARWSWSERRSTWTDCSRIGLRSVSPEEVSAFPTTSIFRSNSRNVTEARKASPWIPRLQKSDTLPVRWWGGH